ncbi:MAG: CinA family protein [Anaerolineaceae bacterium]|nr:CinA family protein [Anaerolineaceae bacterium]
MEPHTGIPLEIQVGELLHQKGWKLAVAESCTGGLVGHLITNIPGSSEYYQGSITAYAYEAKERLLGVHHETIVQYGVVSEPTVLEMAQGVRRVFDAEVGISVSGIAGPGGGMPGKPVGLVWFGLSTPQGAQAVHFQFHGDRLENKVASAQTALQLLVDVLQGRWPCSPSK